MTTSTATGNERATSPERYVVARTAPAPLAAPRLTRPPPRPQDLYLGSRVGYLNECGSTTDIYVDGSRRVRRVPPACALPFRSPTTTRPLAAQGYFSDEDIYIDGCRWGYTSPAMSSFEDRMRMFAFLCVRITYYCTMTT